MKYIDADRLKAEIERREVILDKYKDSFETAACCKQELEWMKDFITSIQQEQPEVDLEKEVKDYFMDSGYNLPYYECWTIARHFFELGKNTRKEG